MDRKIIGYDLDEENDWVAILDCHHGQHVRHTPPLRSRPWVTTSEGRMSKLGYTLNCVRCDILEIPENLVEQYQTEKMNETTIPNKLITGKTLETGCWAKIQILSGKLTLCIDVAENKVIELTASDVGVIVPSVLFLLKPNGTVSFYLTYYNK